jgi:hypothetical protein
LDPAEYQTWLKEGDPTFPSTIHIEFEPGFITEKDSKEVCKLISEYGDFYLAK